MSSHDDRQRMEEYEEEVMIAQDYDKLLSNSSNLNFAANYLYESLVMDTIMTMCFRAHFESKHPEAFENIESDPAKGTGSDHSSGNSNSGSNKMVNIKCSNCSKVVSTNKFASHLERCMGFGRNSTRIASRKKTTNYEYESDDESESDNWNDRKTKKKNGNNRSNGKRDKKNYM